MKQFHSSSSALNHYEARRRRKATTSLYDQEQQLSPSYSDPLLRIQRSSNDDDVTNQFSYTSSSGKKVQEALRFGGGGETNSPGTRTRLRSKRYLYPSWHDVPAELSIDKLWNQDATDTLLPPPKSQRQKQPQASLLFSGEEPMVSSCSCSLSSSSTNTTIPTHRPMTMMKDRCPVQPIRRHYCEYPPGEIKVKTGGLDLSSSISTFTTTGPDDDDMDNHSYSHSSFQCDSNHVCYASTPRHHGDRFMPSKKIFPFIEIEISPGNYMPLRGSMETMDAVESGRVAMVQCLVCSEALCCVDDCELVICPDCRVLSPVPTSDESTNISTVSSTKTDLFVPWSSGELDNDQDDTIKFSSRHRGGVGLGFKI